MFGEQRGGTRLCDSESPGTAAAMESSEDVPAGVYVEDDRGLRCLHRFELGDYGLEHVAEFLQLGTLCPHSKSGWTCLMLEGHELREIKVQADAYSFDFDEGFIQMCLDIVRAYPAAPARVKLWANF